MESLRAWALSYTDYVRMVSIECNLPMNLYVHLAAPGTACSLPSDLLNAKFLEPVQKMLD